MKVAPDITAVRDGTMNGSQCFAQETGTTGIMGIGQAAFGDVDGLVVLGEAFEHWLDGPRFEIPAEIVLPYSEWDRSNGTPGSPATDADIVDTVELNSDSVTISFEAVKELTVTEIVEQGNNETGEQLVLVGVHEGEPVRKDDGSVWLAGVDHRVDEFVCMVEVFDSSSRTPDASTGWRAVGRNIATANKGVGFVENSPEYDKVFVLRDHPLGKSQELCSDGRIFPVAILRFDPGGVGPVPEGDERFHTASTEGEDDLSVVLDGRLVEFTFAWLDAGPFDGEAMGIVSERGREVEVRFVAGIMFASSAGNIGVWVCCLRSECVPIRIPTKSLF